MFRQAKPNRTFEDVFSQIQESILKGDLKAGDKLPSERRLREIFKISRGSLREALRALEQKGLLTIKTGVQGGAIVCNIDAKRVSESLDLLLKCQKINMKELTEFREDVEGLIVEKVAKIATKENINELKNYLKEIRKLIRLGLSSWEKVVEIDKLFHLSLARIINNRIYESVLNSIYDNINSYLESFLPRNLKILENNYKELYKIMKAIEERNPQKARYYFQEHVKPYYKRLMIEEKRRKFILDGRRQSLKRFLNKSNSKES